MRLQRLSGAFPRILTAAGFCTAAAAFLLALPPFLATPLWVDCTHYDAAARNLLAGGTPYRDIFDTNLPGMVWAHAAARLALGWSVEALRCADLLVMVAVALLLARFVRLAGAGPAAAAWLLAGVALFYPFATEFAHAQRDGWMLLPALLAARIRRRDGASVRARLAEGFLWGVAVWIKPHAVVPAAAVWLASRPWRNGALADLAAVVAGGALAGVAGGVALAASGGGAPFWDVMTNWNPDYARQAGGELPRRFGQILDYFPPWGYAHIAALPLALRELAGANRPRAVLAALYLGWWGQALLLQKGLDYVHLPETLLALAVLAARSVPVGLVALPALLLTAAAPNRESFERFAVGVGAMRHGATPAVRDRLSHFRGVHCATEWVALTDAADFLRSVEPPLRDRELIGWHDSTHPLYAMLGVRPGIRFLHVGTAWEMAARRADLAAEVRAAPARYVVSDLARMTWAADPAAPSADGNPAALPAWFPRSQRAFFPWDQPVAFRAGRYVVHRIERPIGAIAIPAWEALGDLGPP